MESSDQSQRDSGSDKADGQVENAEIKEMLYSFAHKIYDVRTDAAEWQKVLHDSPDEVVTFFSEKASVLANILSAGSEKEINGIIDQAVKGSEQGQEIDKEPVTSPESTIKESAPEEASSAPTGMAASEKQSEDGETESSKETSVEEASTGVSNQAKASEGENKQVAKSKDSNLVRFLRQLYAIKDEDDSKLQDLLSSTSDEVLSRVESNPFYFEKVMGMTTENHLNEFLDEVQAAAGPMNAEGIEYSDEVRQGNIDYLLGNWAYINLDCRVSNPENKNLKDAGISEGPMQWMSLAGVPFMCMPGKEGKVTVAASMMGMMNGLSSDTELQKDDTTIDKVVYGMNESPEMRRMIVAFDLVRYIKDFEMCDVKIRMGQRELMRNFWSVAKINGVPCVGFEPTPEELAWYEKREMLLRENFSHQDALQKTKSPGLTPLGSSGVPLSREDEQEERKNVAAEENKVESGKGKTVRPVEKKTVVADEKAESSDKEIVGAKEKSEESGQEKTVEPVKEKTQSPEKQASTGKESAATKVAKKDRSKESSKKTSEAKEAKSKKGKGSTGKDN